MSSQSTTEREVTPSVPLAPVADVDSVSEYEGSSESESSQSDEDSPSKTPDPWIWKCRTCKKKYPVAVTGRCLTCPHRFCSGFTAKALGKPPCCSSVFDFVGWRRMMGWKRKTFCAGEDREGGRCDVDCDFPNECQGLTASERVERAYKKGARRCVDKLHKRTREPTPDELETLKANCRTAKRRSRYREDCQHRYLPRSGEALVFKEGEIDAYYERQGKTRPSERVKYSKVKRLVRRRKKQLAALKKKAELMAWVLKRKFDEQGASVVDSLAKGSRAEREWREEGERPAKRVRVRT